MDDVFRALANSHRRQLLDRLNARNGQTLRELCADLDMTRQAVSKHLAVLEAALLVTTVRQGREKLHYLNPAPIHEIADRWINRYDRARVEALTDLKHALEDTDMTQPARTTGPDRPEFVYTTYIRTTPERLFAALTEPAFTQRYWDLEFDTDWQRGSTMTWVGHDLRNAHVEQLVLEYDPPRRLSYTWHTFTPEWAESVGIDEEVRVRIAREPRSRATFDLEPDGALVKLTVIHDGFETDSEVLQMVTGGWPRVVGSLKTLLETGDLDDGYSTHAVSDAPVSAVFDALTTLDGLGGWWMPDVSGDPATVGGDVTFRFDDEHVTMRVEHLEPALVVWRCTDSTRMPEWTGNTVWFDLRERDAGRTEIHFEQVGLVPSCDCFEICSGGWDHYIASLASFAAGDGGQPRESAEWEAARVASATR